MNLMYSCISALAERRCESSTESGLKPCTATISVPGRTTRGHFMTRMGHRHQRWLQKTGNMPHHEFIIVSYHVIINTLLSSKNGSDIMSPMLPLTVWMWVFSLPIVLTVPVSPYPLQVAEGDREKEISCNLHIPGQRLLWMAEPKPDDSSQVSVFLYHPKESSCFCWIGTMSVCTL